MSPENKAHLVRMANQIAANLAAQGEARAISETAAHIRAYWDPAMRRGVLAADQALLSPIAREALRQIAAPSQ